MTLDIQRSDNRVVMRDVSWEYYVHTLRELGPSRNVRITYDRGRMEIMTLGPKHERARRHIGRLLEMYASESRITMTGLGQLTCQREDLEKGLEPDDCYFIMSPPPEGDTYDLTVDPPPDLAIEVDITHSSMPRQSIYAALGVPEIWRYKGDRITVLNLQTDGGYAEAERSRFFPRLAMEEFMRFVKMAFTDGQSEAVWAIQDWVRAGQR
jgi:Uma2 family endonuclease